MGAEPADAAVLWEAAADAMSWTAAMRAHDSLAECRKGWAARVEFGDAMKGAAEKCGRIVDGRGMVDTASIGLAGDAMRRAADPLVRASRAFARSSRLDKAAGAELDRASRAYGRAEDPEYAAAVAERAARSRDHALSSAGMAKTSLDRAESLVRDAAKLAAAAAAKQPPPGPARRSDLTEMSSLQADMWEGAKQDRLESAVALGRMDEAVQATARIRQLTARAAEMSAARAAAAAARGRGSPDVERAAAAWRRAVAKAHGVEDRSRRRDANRAAQAGPPVL